MEKIEDFLDKRLGEINKANAMSVASHRLTICYVLKQNKSEDDSTLYVRLRYLKSVMDISTGIRCRADKFLRDDLVLLGEKDKTKYLQTFVERIEKTFADLYRKGDPFNLSDLKEEVLGLSYKTEIPNILTAFETFHKWVTVHGNSNKIEAGTQRKYNNWRRRFRQFFISKYGKNGKLETIVMQDAYYFIDWLKQVRNYSHNSTQYATAHFKRFTEFCHGSKWLQYDPLVTFQKKLHPKETFYYLHDDELKRLTETKIHIEELDRARDTFIFMYQGSMNHKDLSGLKKQHLMTSNEGKKYIVKQRSKTKQSQTVPLSETALKIMAKYENDPATQANDGFVPYFILEVLNRYLKQIAGICGVNKKLSTRFARCSSITNHYSNGENTEAVQMIAGHKVGSQITANHYIKQSPEILVKRMENLQNK